MQKSILPNYRERKKYHIFAFITFSKKSRIGKLNFHVQEIWKFSCQYDYRAACMAHEGYYFTLLLSPRFVQTQTGNHRKLQKIFP